MEDAGAAELEGPDRSRRHALFVLGGLVASGAGVLACGRATHAPRITALRLSPPAGVHPTETLALFVDFIDEDGHLAGGKAEIGLRRAQEPEGQVLPVPISGGGSSRGTVEIAVQLPSAAIPGSYEIAVTLIDSTKRRSNALVAMFDVLA